MYFAVKCIEFMGRKVNILLQNKNGPCPLIAIANILLLQGKIKLWENIAQKLEDVSDINFTLVEVEEVIHLVAEAIIYEHDKQSRAFEDNEPIAEVLDLLPKLQEGLDLNVIFTNSTSFEFTREISVFDSLRIFLYHGWLPDERPGSRLDEEMYCAVKDLSYNHLVFKIVEYKASAQSNSNEGSDTTSLSSSRKGWLFEQYLEVTSSQLTYAGLLDIYRSMQDRQLAVFFRNNHFSTIFCINGQIFSLVTDLGYQEEPGVVWELLDQGYIQGNSDYYDSFFQRSNFAFSAPPSPIRIHSPNQSYPQEQGTIASPRITRDGLSEQDGWVRVHASDGSSSPPPPPPPLVDASSSNSEGKSDRYGSAVRSAEPDCHGLTRRDTSRTEADLGNLHLSQEEQDFQHALLLQMEEDRLDQQSRAEQGRIHSYHNPPPRRAEPPPVARSPGRVDGGRGRAARGSDKGSSGCSVS